MGPRISGGWEVPNLQGGPAGWRPREEPLCTPKGHLPASSSWWVRFLSTHWLRSTMFWRVISFSQSLLIKCQSSKTNAFTSRIMFDKVSGYGDLAQLASNINHDKTAATVQRPKHCHSVMTLNVLSHLFWGSLSKSNDRFSKIQPVLSP